MPRAAPPVGSKRSRREAEIAVAGALEVTAHEDGAPLPPLPENQCQSCGAVFANARKCLRHVRSVHMRIKPFSCKHCGAAFAEAGHLRKHIDAVHLGLKPHECEHCGAAFAQTGQHKTHVDAVHLGLKPHKCKHCSAAFAEAGHLKPLSLLLIATQPPVQKTPPA